MIFYIGEKVKYKGKIMYVQDTDMLNGDAKIGEADENDIIWDAKWISWDFIEKIDK